MNHCHTYWVDKTPTVFGTDLMNINEIAGYNVEMLTAKHLFVASACALSGGPTLRPPVTHYVC